MKIGVVGNRTGWTYNYVKKTLLSHRICKNDNDIIISGGAEGVDTFAQEFAKEYGLEIRILYPDPLQPSPDRYFNRNLAIVLESDLIIAFDKGSSTGSGTQNTINHAKRLKKNVITYRG